LEGPARRRGGRQRGPKQQARAVQRRCQARLAELGFAGLEEYLRTTTSASLAALVK
jgi:hypothetical protein